MKTKFIPGHVYVPISGQPFVMFVPKSGPSDSPNGAYVDILWEDGSVAQKAFAYETLWKRIT